MEESKYPPGSRENPIKCNGVDGEHEYLKRLRSPDGKPVEYERRGSVFVDEDGILDVYHLQYDGLEEAVTIFMDMYAGGKDKRVMEGFCSESDFLKPANWEQLEHFRHVAEQELGTSNPETPAMFVYIWAKSGRMLRMGPWLYAENDFWGLPAPEWNLKQILDCASQVVHQLRGISEDRPLLVPSAESALRFMETMHFKPDGLPAEFMEKVGRFSGKNEITGEKAVFYFSILV